MNLKSYSQNQIKKIMVHFDYASETGYSDSLRVGLITREFNEWLTNKAYK